MRTSVLVVEDEPGFMRRFSDTVPADPGLRLAGVVSTGHAAIALPGIGGVAVIRHAAAKHHPGCDVLVVTMFGDDAHATASIEAGATGSVLGHACGRRIASAVPELRAGGSPNSPSSARRRGEAVHEASRMGRL